MVGVVGVLVVIGTVFVLVVVLLTHHPEVLMGAALTFLVLAAAVLPV
jgi:hypothetical protein